MTDRYARSEPLIPEWAGPAYLIVSALTALTYLALVSLAPGAAGLALTKALGIVMLGLYALVNRAPLLAIALVLSSGGDFALDMRPPQVEAGVGFFAAAHIAYIGIFVLAIIKRGLRKDGFLLAAALAAYGAAMLVWLGPGMGDLRLSASVYLGIILVMAALAALVHGPRLITLGALLFVVSDTIIAARWFRQTLTASPDVLGGYDWAGALIWVLYYGAQISLAVGVVRMKRAMAESD